MFLESPLDLGEAVEEFFVGAFESDFGIDAEFAGEVGHDEEEVSDLGLEFGRSFLSLGVFGEFLADLGEFFVDLFGNADGAGPVEADLAGFLLELGGAEEGGEAFANPVEEGFFFVAFFGALDVFPLGEDTIGGADGRIAIDVGMTADEFVADAAGDVVEIEAIAFLCELGVKDNLQEKVAEFFLEIFVVLGLDCGNGFVSFLDKIGDEGIMSLLGVPRTTAGGTKTMHDSAEAVDLAVGLRAGDHLFIGH